MTVIAESQEIAVQDVDLAVSPLRELNRRLHASSEAGGPQRWRVRNPNGLHAIAAGMDAAHDVEIHGHVGYYCAGMNQRASVRVHGNCGVGVAENMMSGTVVVEGNASQAAAATAHGGLLVVRGDASARCAISLKGADVVVGGSAGHLSAFMAQKGALVICGDAGEALGDSIYEARVYVRGAVTSLGADCIEKPMAAEHLAQVRDLLDRAQITGTDPAAFRRYGSARRLYSFHPDDAGPYRLEAS